MKSDQFPPLSGIVRQPKVVTQVAEHLAKLISDGLLDPGQKLPGETVLAKRLGVSRPTLREALGILRSRGLVEVRPRSGTYVSSALTSAGLDSIEDLLAVDPTKLGELLEVRRIVDAGAAALAARRRTSQDLAELRSIVDGVAGIDGSTLLTSPKAAQAYRGFFAAMARATHNTLYTHLVDSMTRLLRNSLRYAKLRLMAQPESGEIIREQLSTILDHVEAGDAHAAREATVRHLEYVDSSVRRAAGAS